jgi:hypothetical protein
MAVETLTATRRGLTNKTGHGAGGNMKFASATVEISASATNASVYTFFRVPSNARILGLSSYSIDDCDTGSTATVDFGFFAVNGNITSDDDALNDGIVAGTAATRQPLVKDIANYGKKAWEFVNGQTTDPGGSFDLKATLQDGAISATGGTLTVELAYAFD